MNGLIRIPAVVMRGGTSKGVILKGVNLPVNKQQRDNIILKIFGSPDQLQIDGLGGGKPTSSKLVIVDPPSHPDAQINYTFGQVSLDKSEIDYKPTCGNMATAVGLFAVEEGYVKLVEPVTTIKVYNTNIDKIIEVEIAVKNKEIQYDGDFSIDGVSGTASKIMVNFLDSGGTITTKLLPSGNVKDTIALGNGKKYDVSIIDSANVVVFVKASDLNIKGDNFIEQFTDDELLNTLESIRVEAGFQIGLIKDKRSVTPSSHALPKIAVLFSPQNYTGLNRTVYQEEVNIIGMYMAMGQLHQAFAVSGAIAVGTGAKIPGTVVHEIVGEIKDGLIKIGHPSGLLAVDVCLENINGEYKITRAAVARTARRLMDGYAYIPSDILG